MISRLIRKVRNDSKHIIQRAMKPATGDQRGANTINHGILVNPVSFIATRVIVAPIRISPKCGFIILQYFLPLDLPATWFIA